MSVELVIQSNHFILYCPRLLLLSIFPSIRVFSNELALRWPKSWSFSFSISPSNEYSRLISLRIDWIDLLAVQGTLTSLVQHHNLKASILQHSVFFMVQLLHLYMTTGKIIRTDYMDLYWQSNISSFQHTVQICYSFPSKEQVFFIFMVVPTVCSKFSKPGFSNT